MFQLQQFLTFSFNRRNLQSHSFGLKRRPSDIGIMKHQRIWQVRVDAHESDYFPSLMQRQPDGIATVLPTTEHDRNSHSGETYQSSDWTLALFSNCFSYSSRSR